MMAYLNLSSSCDQDPRMMGATPAQVGTWFFLQCYCHRQANGGRIIHCREWPLEAWQRLGIDRATVLSESPLWHFFGPDRNTLIVHLYNVEKEATFKRKQKMGKFYAAKRWHKKISKSEPVGNGLPIESPNGSKMGHPMREEGRKEGKGLRETHDLQKINDELNTHHEE